VTSGVLFVTLSMQFDGATLPSLATLFEAYNDLCHARGIVHTAFIGVCYVAIQATGYCDTDTLLQLALEMQEVTQNHAKPGEDPIFFKAGIHGDKHSAPVIGMSTPNARRYPETCQFGPTVQTAMLLSNTVTLPGIYMSPGARSLLGVALEHKLRSSEMHIMKTEGAGNAPLGDAHGSNKGSDSTCYHVKKVGENPLQQQQQEQQLPARQIRPPQEQQVMPARQQQIMPAEPNAEGKVIDSVLMRSGFVADSMQSESSHISQRGEGSQLPPDTNRTTFLQAPSRNTGEPAPQAQHYGMATPQYGDSVQGNHGQGSAYMPQGGYDGGAPTSAANDVMATLVLSLQWQNAHLQTELRHCQQQLHVAHSESQMLTMKAQLAEQSSAQASERVAHLELDLGFRAALGGMPPLSPVLENMARGGSSVGSYGGGGPDDFARTNGHDPMQGGYGNGPQNIGQRGAPMPRSQSGSSNHA